MFQDVFLNVNYCLVKSDLFNSHFITYFCASIFFFHLAGNTIL